MGGVKITAADKWFSRCVREAAAWRCERCGAQHQEGSTGLHCAHFHTRGKWAVRFEPLNVAACCYGCHSYLDSRPVEKLLFFTKKLSPQEMIFVDETSQQLNHKLKKRTKEIAAHFKQEHQHLLNMRSTGVQGRLTIRRFEDDLQPTQSNS